MTNAAEQQLRRAALVLTAILLLQLVWSGLRLVLTSEPEYIFPAEESLQVGEVLSVQSPDDSLSRALVARPLFWVGRQAYVAEASQESTKPRASRSLGQLTLLGMYTGSVPGIIVSDDGERRRMRLGESLRGWEFTEVLADGVVFKSGADEQLLELEHALVAPQETEGAVVGEDTVRTGDGASRRPPEEHNETTGE